jgi:signal transduction histidine kinase
MRRYPGSPTLLKHQNRSKVATSGLRIDLLLIFFIYGLAFFSMGLATLLEARRSPGLLEAQLLRPLTVFGLVHGAHEWFEIFILQGEWLNVEFPLEISWGRIVLLAVSFAALVAYGGQVLLSARRSAFMDLYIASGALALYLLLMLAMRETPWGEPPHGINHADAMARYALAIPGAILAALALQRQSMQARAEERPTMGRSLHWAALGFLIYGLAQIFVTPTDLGPARYLNSAVFMETTGIPVQLVRAAMAVMITTGVIRATRIIEEERQQELLAAQQERMEALEQVQVELVKREELRREILRRTVMAQEEERARIARELHDETAQKLTAFSINMAALQNRLGDRPELIELVKRLLSLSSQMAKDIYRITHDLRPAQLDDLGLAPALQFLAHETQKDFDLEITLEIRGERQRLDPTVETVLYRVAQEALTNVVRHAQTQEAELHLLFNQKQVKMIVQDKGIGFDIHQEYTPTYGLGLAGMRERVEAVGGQFLIQSPPGEGTLIEVLVPLGKHTRLTNIGDTSWKKSV